MLRQSTLFVILFAVFLAFAASPSLAAPRSSKANAAPDALVEYKKVGVVSLKLHIFFPKKKGDPGVSKKFRPENAKTAFVFYFGGGWVGGSPSQFYPHCKELASQGYFACSAEYRVGSRHKTTPFECVMDGKSAVRFLRKAAKKYGYSPDQIIACGGSAGGHVAATTGTIEDHEEDGEDNTVSSKPNAMILFNPVIDTTSKGYGANKVKGRETEISPAHHVVKGIVPTLIFHGTRDTTVPFENVERFTKLMKKAGNDCTLVPFPEQTHGFFNYSKNRHAYDQTIVEIEKFVDRVFPVTKKK